MEWNAGSMAKVRHRMGAVSEVRRIASVSLIIQISIIISRILANLRVKVTTAALKTREGVRAHLLAEQNRKINYYKFKILKVIKQLI